MKNGLECEPDPAAHGKPDDLLLDAVELSLVPGLGNVSVARMAGDCPALSEVFRMPVTALEGLGLKAEVAEMVRAHRYRKMAEEIVDWGRRENCHFIVCGAPGYPRLLSEIFDPPVVLYARGNVRALESPAVAIVGTRRPTVYGLQVAEGLAEDIGQRGVAVVSGLARGIDAAAHRGALRARGQTIAIFGCGIDIVYPREHQRLVRQILEDGLIVSEFAPGTSPSPQNFPVRNRIISGLSLGTLIVEASEYSGSLITARLAMEQNREVYAVPGNLTSPQSFGPNYLIKQGAKLVQSWRDIVEEFPADLRSSILAREDAGPARPRELDLLTTEENALLGLLETDRATSFDKIYLRSGLEISRLSNLLLDLEMRGWVRQVPGNLFLKLLVPRK